jgi:hypothetical protein
LEEIFAKETKRDMEGGVNAGNKSVSYLVYIVSNSGMMNGEFSGRGLTEV